MKKLLLFFVILFAVSCGEDDTLCEVRIAGRIKSGNVPFQETEYITGEDQANALCEEYKADPFYTSIVCQVLCP